MLLVLVVLGCLLALSWGPGHHLEFAERVLRRRKELLPRDVAQLLGEERQAYLYGNLAADLINFKNYGGAYNHCHRWAIVEEMREHAHTPRGEAFILGYLSHLAADTIAHNHFVPYHLARYARTKGLGHLYWEMSADRFVPHERWKIVTELKADKRLVALDEIVNRCVPKKALSMRTNKFLFNHVLLVSERERWRHGMARLHPLSDVQLKKGFLALFQDAAVERIRLALHPKGLRELVRVDANGKEAQASAMRMRQGLLERWTTPRERWADSEPRAAGFLEGMESPPPRSA
jgi:hypothetical protein